MKYSAAMYYFNRDLYLGYNSTSRLIPDYIKSTDSRNLTKSRSTMQYNSGQYATVTHYRRGGPGYQNRCAGAS